MLLRRLVPVRPFGALERDHQFLLRVGIPGLQRVLLPANRVIEDLAEDAAHESGIQAEPFTEGRTMLQQRGLPIGIADGAIALSLHGRNLTRQPRSFPEGRHEHRVYVIKALPQRCKVVVRHTRS
jgi:hypothetical protein